MKLLILVATLGLQAATPSGAPAPARVETAAQNIFREPPGCVPIVQQVSGDKKEVRRNGATRLDQQPPAHMLLAVDRQVDGCREVTFIRRNVAPAATPLGQPSR